MAAPISDASVSQQVELLSACPVVSGATVSKALLNLPQARLVIFAMDTGQEMTEHRTPFVASVQVLEGRLRFEVESREREMAAHDWLVMPPGAPHSLTALEPTRFVLTLFKGAEKA